LKAIIFGSNGQDGHYLSRLLERENIRILCISRNGESVIGDVRNYGFVEEQIKNYRPNYVFNFAARSTTQHNALFENHQTISTGTLNILESVRLYNPEGKVFLSGSAMQFKNEELPIDEQTPFDASSPYSIARIQSVYAARYYRKAFGLKVYVGYLFNHDSPLRTEQHVNQKIVKAVKGIAEGSSEKLELGNIDIKKEFNYAADIVEAIWVLVNQDRIYETVIGSGEAHSIKDWLAYCFNKINRKWQDYVVIKQDFIPEYRLLVSNPRIIKSLGWKAKVSFLELADIMLNTLD
jgi:GDPmannose 4,6-dehydratase